MLLREVTTTIDPLRCIGCGKCIPVCPSDTLAMRDGKAVVVGKESLQCGHCAAVCPADAVSVGALDPRMLQFETFPFDPSWLPHGKADAGALVRLMASRRSCRNYRKDPVPRDDLRDLVKVACTAPSGTNNQPWSFTILPDRPAVEALARRVLALFQKILSMASNPLLRTGLKWIGMPELDAFHRDYAPSVREGIREFRETGRDRLFHGAPAAIVISTAPGGSTPGEDAMLATQNLLLAAHAMGYGTCLIGFAVEAIARDRSIAKALGIPAGHKVRSVIALGRPAEQWHTVAGRRGVEPGFLDADAIDRGDGRAS